MVDRVQYLMFESPVGKLLVVGDARAICRICFQDGSCPAAIDGQWQLGGDLVGQAVRELEEYFSGKKKQFTVPVALKGTAFQNRAWLKWLSARLLILPGGGIPSPSHGLAC